MGSRIVTTGAGLPEKIVSNAELGRLIEGIDDAWVVKRTGIRERRIVTGENTSDLAAGASRQVLERSGTDAKEIDLIVAASITPDYQSPNLASMVQRQLGADNAVCFVVSAACSGFMFALSVADKYVSAGLAKRAIVIGAEVLSKATDWEDKNTCVLFGDGAGAVLLESSDKPSILQEEMGSKGSKSNVLTSGYSPAANPFNETEPVKPEDAYIRMDGLEVFSFAVKRLSAGIVSVLDKEGLSLKEIKYIVPHQANLRIIDAVAKRLSAPMDKFYMNLERFGNTSSASIPIALNELNGQGKLQRGDKLILAGFGGGLTWGTMLIEW
ncbi:MAG: ketoacyl-ACP synthase III [Lachnospiraceae bacterium]|nr:ketoacyl-ACP synthase III [Lachnospiraceae bacterium]